MLQNVACEYDFDIRINRSSIRNGNCLWTIRLLSGSKIV